MVDFLVLLESIHSGFLPEFFLCGFLAPLLPEIGPLEPLKLLDLMLL